MPVIRYLRVYRRWLGARDRSYYGNFAPVVSESVVTAANNIFACQFIDFGNTRIVPCTVAVLPTVRNGETWKPRRQYV